MSWLKIDATGGRLLVGVGRRLLVDPDLIADIPGFPHTTHYGPITAVPGLEHTVPGVHGGTLPGHIHASSGSKRRADLTVIFGRDYEGRVLLGRSAVGAATTGRPY